MRLVDSHVHLADYPHPEEVVRLARATGTLVVTNGVDRGSSERGAALARASPGVVEAFVGIHPSHAKVEDPGWVEVLARGARGVGEVGLDPKYSETGRGSRQAALFEAQLGVAEREGAPVQVHSRGAERECLDLLTTFRVARVLMHWFEGEALVSELASRGYYVSFGPALLYSKKLQKVAAAADPNRILAETDGPVAFAPLSGANGPALVASVAFKLAELWRVDFESAVVRLLANSRAYLQINEKG